MKVSSPSVAVLGATGFVGSAVVAALEARGAQVVPISAPRLPPCAPAAAAQHGDELVDALRAQMVICDIVINAAGIADAASSAEDELIAANGALPGLIGRAAESRRFVHVSSAAVQGDVALLDDEPAIQGFSPYSWSKIIGERTALDVSAAPVVYRPPGVHGAQRRVTRQTARLARSPLSSVASPGIGLAPQALIGNVADAIAFLALSEPAPPRIVNHPAEGLTVTDILELLGGRSPTHIPAPVARALVRLTASVGGRLSSSLAATARRLEVLWFGQEQGVSWLSGAGWAPPEGHDGWSRIGRTLALEHRKEKLR